MKRLIVCLLTAALLTVLAACTTNETPVPTPTPSPELTAEPSPSPEAGATFRPVATGAKLIYGETDVKAPPYYGANDEILLPLQPLAEAMGWRVDKSSAGNSEAMLITKPGADDVTIQYMMPSVGQAQVSGVTAKKGTTDLVVAGTLPYADGTIYVTVEFYSEALEPIDAEFDGDSTVRVTQRAG